MDGVAGDLLPAVPGHGGGHLAVPSPDVGVGDLLGGFMTRGK